MPNHKLLAPLTVASGSAAMNAGQVIVFSLLPLICLDIGLQGWHAGLILSISSMCFALVSPIWGRLSERFGRVPVLTIGLAGYSFGTLTFTLLLDHGSRELLGIPLFLTILVIARSFQSLLMGAIIPSSTAYIVDTTPLEKRAQGMALLGAAQNIGAILGPITISALASYSLLHSLYAATVYTAISCALVYCYGDRVNTAGKPHIDIKPWPLIKNIAHSFSDKRYRLFSLAGIGIFISFSIVQQPLAYWLQAHFSLSSSESASWIGAAMTSFAVAGAFIQLFIIPRLKLQPRQYLIPGFLLIGSGALCILNLKSYSGLIIGMTAMGIGLSIAFVGYAGELSSRVNEDERGQAGGVIGATPAVGFMIGPLAGAFSYEINDSLPFIITSGLCTGLILLTWIEHRQVS